jgi:hypothetical protein
MKPVVLTPNAWRAIRDELHNDYPRSVFALRSKMRTVLGFTIREHRRWEPELTGYKDEVHLDFYSENKRTMFLLKFSDLINIVENKL